MKLKNILFHLMIIALAIQLSGCERKCPEIEPEEPVVIVDPVTPIQEDVTIDAWTDIPNSFSGNLTRLDFPSTDIGYICGVNGIILKTTDGGSTFNQMTSGTTQVLYTIDFVNENVGYVGGNGNTLLKTTDGGLTWAPKTVGADIKSIYFFDENTGFIGGFAGYLSKTTDGGQTWTTINSGSITSDLHCIHFVNSNIGFISGYQGYLAKTTDGGQNWNALNTGVTFTGNAFLWDISFINETIGYVCGGNIQSSDNYIIKTTDGGASWIRQTSPINNSSNISIRFTDQNNGYLTCRNIPNQNNGNILKTTNGGVTWLNEYSTSSGLHGLFLLNSGKGFAVGNNSSIIKGD